MKKVKKKLVKRKLYNIKDIQSDLQFLVKNQHEIYSHSMERINDLEKELLNSVGDVRNRIEKTEKLNSKIEELENQIELMKLSDQKSHQIIRKELLDNEKIISELRKSSLDYHQLNLENDKVLKANSTLSVIIVLMVPFVVNGLYQIGKHIFN